MAEPFKNVFNEEMIGLMAGHFLRHDSDFDATAFETYVLNGFELLEFKQRSNRICEAMIEFLPDDFEQSAQVLEASLGEKIVDDWDAVHINASGISGWAIIPMADYVAAQGKTHFDLSMHLLKELTKRSSSEFAIRPFLDSEPEKTIKVLEGWARDENEHVRRLASEGCRPRLPWGLRLKGFVENPQPVLRVLELLKDDSSEYVRRSVANNLNDIAKDHPDLVADIAEDWLLGASLERVKLVKHACRTLVKSGHPKTLTVLGFGPAKLRAVTLAVSEPILEFGGAVELSLKLESDSNQVQELMIDYIVHHQKANGSTSPKVFKWKVATLKAGQSLKLSKKHSVKPITTRVYYPGVHKVDLQINGKIVADTEFELVM